MIEEIRALVDGYSTWLRDKSVLRQVGDKYVEISTPFVDRNNDNIQIYVRRDGDGFLLTDAGETIADLRLSGCELDTPKRESLFRSTLNGFAVSVADGELQVLATEGTFSGRKHNLVQAMLAVNDLFYLAAPTIASLFHEDVAHWLKEVEIPFVPNVRFVGKTGLSQHFDFAIPATRTKPERLVNALAHPDRQRVMTIIQSWEDTKDSRSFGSQCMVMVNDAEQVVRPELLGALKAYGITPLRWTAREQAFSALNN